MAGVIQKPYGVGNSGPIGAGISYTVLVLYGAFLERFDLGRLREQDRAPEDPIFIQVE